MQENLAIIISSLSGSIHSRTRSSRRKLRSRSTTMPSSFFHLDWTPSSSSTELAAATEDPKMRSLFTPADQFVKTKAHPKADPLSSPLTYIALSFGLFSVSRLSFLTFFSVLDQICCFHFFGQTTELRKDYLSRTQPLDNKVRFSGSNFNTSNFKVSNSV